MSIFSDNLRYLRERFGESQQKTADKLDIKRGRYEPYESGKVEPPYTLLVKLSRHYGISIDLLLTVDLRKYKIEELFRLADNRIVLPIAVDQQGKNLIEIVPHKARMGYASGYADPDFIDGLQTLSLPFLKNGKFRAFPGSGDSMPPHKDSSFIIGEYVEQLSDVKEGKTYVLVTRNDGIVYKRISRSGDTFFTAVSDNAAYAPYELPHAEILEIWAFVCSIETEAFEPDDLKLETIREMFHELRHEIRKIKPNKMPLN